MIITNYILNTFIIPLGSLLKDFQESMPETKEQEFVALFTAVLEKSKSLSILPCCMGLIKYKGDPTILNVSNFKLGNKYVEALAAGLKEAKMI